MVEILTGTQETNVPKADKEVNNNKTERRVQTPTHRLKQNHTRTLNDQQALTNTVKKNLYFYSIFPRKC